MPGADGAQPGAEGLVGKAMRQDVLQGALYVFCNGRVYSVRFPAQELWGEESACGDAVYVDLWESYLDAE